MKKALSLLVAVSFYCNFVASPLFAGEIIVYDGSDTTMLKTIVGSDNSLAPSGSETGKSSSLSGNKIIVSADVVGVILGAINFVDSQDVLDNRVTINGGTVSEVLGGRNHSGKAIGNTVIINDGEVYSVAGGVTTYGSVTDNSVIVNDGTVRGNVYGGSINALGTATNNSVLIKGGTVQGNVYGASIYSSYACSATYNTITIYESANLTYSVIYGGLVCAWDDTANAYVTPAGADTRTGNTFNLIGSNSIRGIQNFANYNFYLPKTASNGSTMLYVDNGNGSGAAINISNCKIEINGSGGVVLNAGDVIILIDSNDKTINAAGINTVASGSFGVSKIYDFELKLSTGNYKLCAIYTGNSLLNWQTKILSEGVAAGAIMALQASDNKNGTLLSGLREGKTEIFGTVFGGSSKYDTGSSVEMNAFGIVAGVAKKFNALNAGIFIEYTNGSYDTEYENLKGDGSASAIGGGILAKKDINGKVYIEGLIRAGQLANDYKTDLADKFGTTANFDYSSAYYGISLGVGSEFELGEKINIDVSGRYIFTSTGGDTELTTGEKYEFDSILSNRIKLVAKGEYKINEIFKPYLALAGGYELSGDVNVKTDNFEIPAPTLNGGILSAGIGISAKIAEKLTLDLGATLYSGVIESVTGNLQAKYSF